MNIKKHLGTLKKVHHGAIQWALATSLAFCAGQAMVNQNKGMDDLKQTLQTQGIEGVVKVSFQKMWNPSVHVDQKGVKEESNPFLDFESGLGAIKNKMKNWSEPIPTATATATATASQGQVGTIEPVVLDPVQKEIKKEPGQTLESQWIQSLAKELPDQGQEMTSLELARVLYQKDLFMALATVVENVRTKVYFDPGGANIGMGYCITKRRAEYGDERVKKDLKDAQIKDEDVQVLMGKNRSAMKSIKITPLNALALLEITKKDYEQLAVNAMGGKYEQLSPGQKAGLTYLAYNTGNPGAFKNVIQGLKNNKIDQAIMNMSIQYKDNDGNWQSNERAASWIRVFFSHERLYAKAIENPMEFEGSMANAQSKVILAQLSKNKVSSYREKGLAFMKTKPESEKPATPKL